MTHSAWQDGFCKDGQLQRACVWYEMGVTYTRECVPTLLRGVD